MQAQKGFTLIELVVVIVILGILAATALPKFIDLSSDAGKAAAEGVAAAIASGTAINYAAAKAGHSPSTPVTGAASAVCVSATLKSFVTGVTLQDTTTPTDNNTFALTAGTGTCSDGGTITCNVVGKNGSATAYVTCTN